MVPTIGRIVWYTNLGDSEGRYPPEEQAAIITGVKPRDTGTLTIDSREEKNYVVDLHIFYRTGDFFMLDVPFSTELLIRGHWTWPPKE